MCKACEAVRINGVLCHETGCPESHTDIIRECKWCGSQFNPEFHNQEFCDESCWESFNF